MNYSPIVLVAGEPNSIFLEIFVKSIILINERKQYEIFIYNL